MTARPGSTFASIAEEETDPTVSDYEALIESEAGLSGYFRLGEPANYTEFIQSLNPDGYWPMDDASGSAGFNDASGNGFAATATGDITYQRDGPTINGIAQRAIQFDGGNDVGTVDESVDDGATAANGMTLSFWYRTTSTSDGLISQYGGGTDDSWNIWLGSGGTMNLRLTRLMDRVHITGQK